MSPHALRLPEPVEPEGPSGNWELFTQRRTFAEPVLQIAGTDSEITA
jgi:hypothetical protein